MVIFRRCLVALVLGMLGALGEFFRALPFLFDRERLA